MQEFSLVSTTKDSYLLDIATAAKVLDGDEINKIIGKIEADKALAISRSKNAPKELPATPTPAPDAPAEKQEDQYFDPITGENADKLKTIYDNQGKETATKANAKHVEDFDTKICSECKKQNGHEAWCSFAPAPVKEQEEAPIDTAYEPVPEDSPDGMDNRELTLKAEIIALIENLMVVGEYEAKHSVNSLNSHLGLSIEGMDWKAGLISANLSIEKLEEGKLHYADALKIKEKDAKKRNSTKTKTASPSVDMKRKAKEAIYFLPSGDEKTKCEQMYAEAEEQAIDGDCWQMIYDNARDVMDRLKAEKAGQ